MCVAPLMGHIIVSSHSFSFDYISTALKLVARAERKEQKVKQAAAAAAADVKDDASLDLQSSSEVSR